MNKYTKFVLIMIIIAQSVLYIFIGSNKLGYHMDEIYSYGLANSYEYQWAVIEEGREYHPHEIFSEYVNVNNEHKFDYTIDWRNQALDVHPPIFYVLLHTMSIIFNSDFSQWPGIVLNVIVAIFLTIGVYFLSRKYTRDDKKALVITAITAFSLGTTNNVMYIRMYTLFTVWAVWFAYLIYKTLQEKKPLSRSFAIPYVALLTLGVMTQYYFLIYAFFICAIVAVLFLYDKRIKDLVRLITYSAISGVLCIGIFPYMLKHLVGGKRGRDSFKALFKFSDWLSDLNSMITEVCKQIFISKAAFFVVIFIILVIAAVCVHKNKSLPRDYMWVFSVAGILFFLMISKIAPFAADRYVFCLYPIIIISTFGFILKNIDQVIETKQSAAVIALSALMLISTIGNYFINQIPYQYSQNQIKWDITEQYKNTPCLFVYDYESSDVFWDFPQIREYDSLRFIRKENINHLSDFDMDKYDQVVVFVLRTFDQDECLNEILDQNSSLSSSTELYTSNNTQVYFCE